LDKVVFPFVKLILYMFCVRVNNFVLHLELPTKKKEGEQEHTYKYIL